MTAPIELPVNKMPKASGRRAPGSARLTACAADGNDGASAAPSKIRSTKSMPNENAAA